MSKYTVYTAYHPYQGYVIAQDIDIEVVKEVAWKLADRLCTDIDVYSREYDPASGEFDEDSEDIAYCTSII